MTTLFHGAHSTLTIGHEGQCFTEDLSVAECFARSNGTVIAVELDEDALVVEWCEGYDHDSDDCPADHAEFRAEAAARGVDILCYDDEDEQGRELTCWRIVSDRAISAVRATAQVVEDSDEY